MASPERLRFDRPGPDDTTMRQLVDVERRERKNVFTRLGAAVDRLLAADTEGHGQVYFKTWMGADNDTLVVWLAPLQGRHVVYLRAITNLHRKMLTDGASRTVLEIGDFFFPRDQNILSAQYTQHVIGALNFADNLGPYIYEREGAITMYQGPAYIPVLPTNKSPKSYTDVLDRRVNATRLLETLQAVPLSTHEPTKLLPPESIIGFG